MADNRNALRALSQALLLEESGLAFYLQAAERAGDDAAEALLRSLADDERLHLEMIQRQLHALEGGGGYVLLPDLTVAPIDLTRRIFAPARGTATRLGVDAGIMDILHVALDNEIRSYDLYRAAAQETADVGGRRMYQYLAGAELSHFNLLMANYESLSQRGAWV